MATVQAFVRIPLRGILFFYGNSAQNSSLLNEKILEAFLHFSVLMGQNRERDIKYFATKCLIGLTGFEATRDIAIMHLSHIMNRSSKEAKIVILVRVSQINCEEESFLEQILNKGKSDSNYLVNKSLNENRKNAQERKLIIIVFK